MSNDNNERRVKVDDHEWEMANVTPGWGKAEPLQPVGFPWALVIQILMAILSYLMQRASTKPERDHFAGLKTALDRWEVK